MKILRLLCGIIPFKNLNFLFIYLKKSNHYNYAIHWNFVSGIKCWSRNYDLFIFINISSESLLTAIQTKSLVTNTLIGFFISYLQKLNSSTETLWTLCACLSSCDRHGFYLSSEINKFLLDSFNFLALV